MNGNLIPDLSTVIKEKVAKVTVQPFEPRSGVVIHTTDSEATAAAGGSPGE